MYEATLKIGSDIKKSQFEYIEICGYMWRVFPRSNENDKERDKDIYEWP